MTDIIQINETTFKKIIETKWGRATLIGDSSKETFAPTIEGLIFDKATPLKIEPAAIPIGSVSSNLSTPADLVWQDSTKIINIKSLKGPFGWDCSQLVITTGTKPTPNIDGVVRIPFKLENYEDLEFFVQSPVTQKELDMGLEQRNENILYSLAVYHKTGRNNQWTTGKVGHLLRPWVQDDAGNHFWGWWEVGTGVIYKCFLKDCFEDRLATYWLIDLTFGNTADGGSSWGLSAYCHAIYFDTTTEAGNITYMHGWFYNADYPVLEGKMVMYNDDSGPGSKIFTQGTVVVPAYDGNSVDLSFATDGGTLAATTRYWMAVASTGNAAKIRYDSARSNIGNYDNSELYAAWFPSPWDYEKTTTRDYNFSLYCEYDAAGGATAPTGTLSGPFAGPFGGCF